MITLPSMFRSEAILSVRVSSEEAPVIFVVSENPRLTDSVREFLNMTGDRTSVVWLTSIASVQRRLAWTAAAMIIVDDHYEAESENALAALQAASPNTRVLLLTKEDAVTS